MKRIIIAAIALAAAVGAYAQTVEIVSPTAWTLYRGTAIVQPRVTHATEAACIAAAPTVPSRCGGTQVTRKPSRRSSWRTASRTDGCSMREQTRWPA